MTVWPAAHFNDQSISFYRESFRHLPVPEVAMLEGQFKAEFIGPRWLIWLAPKLLPLGGLAGWYGKAFGAPDKAINILRKRDQLIEQVPMQRRIESSRLVQGEALVLSYDRRAPLMLRGLRDEFRALDEHTLLGLTIMDMPLLRSLVLPFLLRRDS